MAIIVKEGDHLKLTCAATGNPKPKISWNLKNGHAIPDGAWKSELLFILKNIYNGMHFFASFIGSNAEGSTLNITQINREHMGTYVCEANNAIGKAYQEFDVQVHCKLLYCVYLTLALSFSRHNFKSKSFPK